MFAYDVDPYLAQIDFFFTNIPEEYLHNDAALELAIKISEYYLYYLRDAKKMLSFLEARILNIVYARNRGELIVINLIKVKNLLAYARYVRCEYSLCAEILANLDTYNSADFDTEQMGLKIFTTAKLKLEYDRDYTEAEKLHNNLLAKLPSNNSNNNNSGDNKNYDCDKALIYHELGRIHYYHIRFPQDKQDNQLDSFDEHYKRATKYYDSALNILRCIYGEGDPLYRRTLLARALLKVTAEEFTGVNEELSDINDPYIKLSKSISNTALITVCGINDGHRLLIHGLHEYYRGFFSNSLRILNDCAEIKKKFKENEYDLDGILEATYHSAKIYLLFGQYSKASQLFSELIALMNTKNIDREINEISKIETVFIHEVLRRKWVVCYMGHDFKECKNIVGSDGAQFRLSPPVPSSTYYHFYLYSVLQKIHNAGQKMSGEN